MVQNIAAVNWLDTSKVNNRRICITNCDSSIDTVWKVQANGTDSNGSPVRALYAIVDNLENNASCRVTFGPQSYLIAPYTRRTFALPDLTIEVGILTIIGIVILTLTEANMFIPDEVNQQAASSGIVAGEYNPYFNILGPTLTDGELIFVHAFERAVEFQPNFNGIQIRVHPTGAPTADTSIDVQRQGGISVGTIILHPDLSYTVTSVGGVNFTFAVGDAMYCVGPTPADATATNFGVTFASTPV